MDEKEMREKRKGLINEEGHAVAEAQRRLKEWGDQIEHQARKEDFERIVPRVFTMENKADWDLLLIWLVVTIIWSAFILLASGGGSGMLAAFWPPAVVLGVGLMFRWLFGLPSIAGTETDHSNGILAGRRRSEGSTNQFAMRWLDAIIRGGSKGSEIGRRHATPYGGFGRQDSDGGG
jgi:hypothetical protein